jgi:5'-3' exonuclease
MILEIFDVNNWCRRVYEKDSSGLALRNLFMTAYTNPNPCIYVFDGKNGKETRRKIFPEYKGGRLPADDAFYVQLELFEMLLEHTNKMRVRIHGWEADDVIAAIIKERKPDGPDIELRSNDGDFMILQNEHVKMTDVSKKLEHIPVEHLRLYKTLCGDTSDNIDGVPTFGPKTFDKMVAMGCVDKWHAILEGRSLGDAKKEDLHLTSGQFLFLQSKFDLMLAYWDVINFIPVPEDLLQKHIKIGTPNMAVANAILKTVFQ